jgi:uncharacterized oxidoreductase
MKPSGNTVLITGGGSGIGRALARRFNAAGNFVIVAGRNRDALEATIDGRADMRAVVIDMEDEESVRSTIAMLIADHPSFNAVIANAGIMRAEDISRSRDLHDAEATVMTNLLGPIRLIDSCIDHLSSVTDPVIITVSSGLAFVPMPSHATYCATKAAIHSYTVSLRSQLAGVVEVIELVPPAVQTDLTPGQSTREGYLPLDQFIDEVMQALNAQPTPPEILVERAKVLRNAEREGRFDNVLSMLSGH